MQFEENYKDEEILLVESKCDWKEDVE